MGGVTRKISFYFLTDFFSQKLDTLLKKYAPLLLWKRERVVSADMKLWRIASTSGVRTYRKNVSIGLAFKLTFSVLGSPQAPRILKRKYFLNFWAKRLDFIRLSDYNIIWIIIGRSEWDRSGPWNTYQSHRPLNDGVFPPGAYRFYVPKGVSQAPSALEQYGAFQMMSQSPQTQE